MSDETKPDQLPETEDENASPLDVIPDLLLDSTIPSPIRKNVFKALRQLSTATMEWLTASLEGKTAEIRAGTKARIQITENITDQITEQIKVPPEYAQSALKKYGEKIIREQINLDRVSAAAINELQQSESDDSTDQSTEGSEEKTISDDFLNSFEEEVRQKSSEEMQLLFGRILAGEIRKPGSYSIKTVKILGELDQNAATLFKKLCSVCVALEISNVEFLLDIRVPALGGNPGSNALSKYGLGFDQLNVLHEYNLIISDYNSWFDYKLCIINKNPPITIPFLHQGRYWVLSPSSPEHNESQEFRVSGVALSRAGRELFPIVDQDSMEAYTEDLKKFFARQNLQMVEVPSQDVILSST